MEFLDRIDRELTPGLALYELLGLAEHQRLDGDVISELRERGERAVEAVMATLPPDDRVSRQDHLITRRRGSDLLVRVYRPKAATGTLPALIWIHGGGMMFGTIDVDGPSAEHYAIAVGCVVVSVDYRLAPEHAYPAALEDCYAALTWCAERHGDLGIDASLIAIGGESAGGGLAAATALLARDRQEPAVRYQLLAYPMLDDRNNTPSALEFVDIPSWSSQHNGSGWRAVLGENAGGVDVSPYAAPARETDLSGLPPSLIQVGELDVFRDEDILYATRLMQAGVATELHVYPGAYHGWDAAAPEASQSVRAVQERIAALRRALLQ